MKQWRNMIWALHPMSYWTFFKLQFTIRQKHAKTELEKKETMPETTPVESVSNS